jgi:hypothetical protein
MKNNTKISPASKTVIETIAETIIPSEGPDRPGAMDIGTVPKLIDNLAEFNGAHRLLIIACWFWEFSPFISGKFSRLSKLTPTGREEVLGKWENSHFAVKRFALVGLKAVFMAAFYNSPEIWEKIGYEQGCLDDHTNLESGD